MRTCPHYVLILHYWWVEDVKRVGHTYISWYTMWSQHKLVDFYDPVTLFLVSWFEKKINLTLRRLQMCSETTKLIFDISKYICFFTLIYFAFFLFFNNICTTFFKIVLHKILQNYLCIVQATYKLWKNLKNFMSLRINDSGLN